MTAPQESQLEPLAETQAETYARFEQRVLAPLLGTSNAWKIWMAFLLVTVGAGFVAYGVQLDKGLTVTGMGDTVVWGVYISNFVFFSGLGMAGTFISGILRLTGAEWRRPLTRFAELSTVAALSMCAIMPAVDMGRPDRLWHLILYGRLESPLVWDILVIPTYLAASIIYLYLFLIPDSATLRDRIGDQVSKPRRKLYSVAAMGWKGLPAQKKTLEQIGLVMAILIIPIGVATHSVVSWIFGTTYRSGWDSTIFAPYFAVGALYSGTALLISLMFIFRRCYHLEEYLTERHFKYLGTLMVIFGALYLYFTFAEYLTVSYKLESGDTDLLNQLFFGRYAVLVWAGFFGGQILPIAIGAMPWTRKIGWLTAASVLVNIGLWIKRFTIVVPSLSLPLLPYEWGVYRPTWVEIAITLASFAGLALIITVFAKFFPIISIWEMQEGWEGQPEGEGETARREPRLPANPPPVLRPQPGASTSSLSSSLNTGVRPQTSGSTTSLSSIVRRSFRPAAIAIIIATALFAFVPHPSYADDVTKVTVKITDAGFDPGTVTVSEGQSVELTFQFAEVAHAEDEHIFAIDGYKVTSEKIDKAHPTSTVKFIATKVGTFPFYCDIECDVHGALQNGQLKVTAGGAGAAAALTPSKFEIDPAANVAVSADRVIVTATLMGNDGKPIPKADVSFLVEQQFVGTTGLMEVGTAKTGAAGIAQLIYRPRVADPEKMVVRFAGQGVYDATEATIQLPGNPLFGPPAKSSSSDILQLKTGAKAGLVILIIAVWCTFAFILYRAWSLRKPEGGGVA